MTQRSITADVLKGMAVIFMIQVHITEVFAEPAIYSSWIGKISLFLGGPPAAPVFMIVMGYFLAKSNKTMPKMLLRGLKLIAGGIALNIALNAHLLFDIANGRSDVSPWDFIFGIDILVLAGATTIIIALVKKILDKHFLLPLLLALIILFLTPYINSYLTQIGGEIANLLAVFGGNLSWSFFPVFPWTAYPLFGYSYYLFSKTKQGKIFENDKIVIPLLILLTIGIAITINYGIEIASELKLYYHHGLVYGLWATVFAGGFALLVNRLICFAPDNGFFDYFSLIGRNVTLAYIVQWVIIGNVGTQLFRSVGLRDSYLALLGVVIMTSLIVWIKDKGYFTLLRKNLAGL